MLVFEHEGFLEVEDSQIEELHHSRATITLSAPGDLEFQLRAVLCRHKAAGSKVFHVAFYCRQLKRALIFGVAPASPPPTTEALAQFLQAFGFQLEPVNLNLNSALRQVVLKDIAGLLSPAEALRRRLDKGSMLAELEAIVRKGPAGHEDVKRAAHKLNAERHLENQAALLRKVLESRLDGTDNAVQEMRDLLAHNDALLAQLQQVQALAEDERRQREVADGIRIAAEKRLQELENELTVAETRMSSGLKSISRLEKKLAKLEKQCTAAVTAIESAKAKEAGLLSTGHQRQEEIGRLRAELKHANARLKVVEQTLHTTEKTSAAAAQTAEKELSALRTHGLAREQELLEISAERDATRADCARLMKAADADKQRLAELESALAEATRKIAAFTPEDKASDLLEGQRQLETALERARTTAQTELSARMNIEQELARARTLINDLEQTVRTLQDGAVKVRLPAEPSPRDSRYEEGLDDTLRDLEGQLEQEHLKVKALSDALDLALKKTIAQEAQLLASGQPAPQPVVLPECQPASSAVAPPAGRKPLPHELRPAPKPGALFHPDWDLTGLPCRSPEQILEGWESIYNVQLTLEGYPSQYCAAFVVILKEGKQKKVYLLFELKQDKHVLICVPGKPPRNEAGLKELVAAARNYLKLSGFEIEKIPSASLTASLKKYFVTPSPG